MKNKKIVIVGAGLSGMSAAVMLVDQGQEVLVLESRGVIGGRTSSWQEGGMIVESGLHRFLGFYEILPGILEKVGVDLNQMLFWEDEIEIRLSEGEPSAVFGLSPLHKPLKTFGALLLNNDFIPPQEKIKISRFFTQGFLEFKKNPKKLDQKTVYQYAKEQDLSEDTIKRELVPLTEGLFFLSVKKYSALNFFALFDPYLNKLQKSRVGAFMGGMSEVMMDPLVGYVRKKGGEVRINAPVEELVLEENQVKGVVCQGKAVKADSVILATSLSQAQRLLQKPFKNYPFFKPMLSLPSMPSVTFQLELREPAMDKDRTTFSPGTIFSSYSEQSRTTFRETKGRLSIILADPEKYLKVKKEQILKQVLEDAQKLGLNLREENIKAYQKISWPEDFYSYEKGTYDLRPPTKTPIRGLVLAGDYTNQAYLSTMEGAAYSGILAAQAIR
jgi:15-cis-phytoene desaturase